MQVPLVTSQQCRKRHLRDAQEVVRRLNGEVLLVGLVVGE
jgi:hypothetical protein